MTPALRTLARARAGRRCEYCRLLNINEPSRVMLREQLLFEGRFPPES
jgi:hypothetical protein